MRKRPTIQRIYTRHYSDNLQNKAYVDWSDGSRTEGEAIDYHGILIPANEHMGALFDHGLRAGLVVERETW